MKTKMNFLKMALMALALMGGTQIFAQVTPGEFPADPTGQITVPADLNGGLVTYNSTTDEESFSAVSGAVMFFRPTTGFTDASPDGSVVNLEASVTDGNGNSFASYLWYEVSFDATAGTEEQGSPITGETAVTFSPKNLKPGYNKFRVRGQMGDTSLYCPSVEYQDVIVFVLPQLEVTPAIPGGTSLTYCIDDLPTTELTATINADYTGNSNDYPKPGNSNDAATDFALTYQWYAIPASAPTTMIALGTTATVDLSTLSTLAPDTYTFYLDVEYDSNIRTKGGRTYVTYGGTGTATTNDITLTPTPGTPTITVLGVDD